MVFSRLSRRNEHDYEVADLKDLEDIDINNAGRFVYRKRTPSIAERNVKRFTLTVSLILTGLMSVIIFIWYFHWSNDLDDKDGRFIFEMDTEDELFLDKVSLVKRHNPNNLCVNMINPPLYYSFGKDDRQRLRECLKSGLSHPGSEVGCYVQDASDYINLKRLFLPVIKAHHGIPASEDVRVATNTKFSFKELKQDDEMFERFDISIRARIARNLQGFHMPASMSPASRKKLESVVQRSLIQLQRRTGIDGKIYSLTPGNKYYIDEVKYDYLVREHLMFKNMEMDPYLKASGISSGWPVGRGMFMTESFPRMIVWYGEEDHIRVIAMDQHAKSITEVVDALQHFEEMLLEILTSKGHRFIKIKGLGYATSCPSNVGTALRLSALIKLPTLTDDGNDEKVAELVAPLGLAVRGINGEHSPVGPDGAVDISPISRINSATVVAKALNEGLRVLTKTENFLLKKKREGT